MTHTLRLCAAVLLAAAVGGCGAPDTAGLIASGKSYIDKGDLPAAVIQLRNAKQQAPDNAEVRFLLGRTLLATGDVAGAEADLRRALELKHPPEQVLPLLAQALLASGETRKLLAEFRPDMVSDPAGKAEIAAALAAAHLGRGDTKEAAQAIDAALAAQPKSVRAHLIKAQVAGVGNDPAGAEAAIDAALALAPKDGDALTMKAGLLAARGRRDDALKLLEDAVAADPSSLATRFALATMRVSSGKVAEAEPVVESMRKDAPKDFRTRYADAMLTLAKGNAAAARDLVQPLLAARPDHAGLLFLAALANYDLKSYAAAEDALRKVIAQAPGDPAPRRVLAATYLRTGRPALAAETAEEVLQRMPDDPVLLRLAGEGRMSSGNIAQATRHFERAAAIEKKGGAAQVRLAQIRYVTGDTGRALDDLERLAKEDDSTIQADLSLYAAHLRRREFDKALAAVASLEKKQPGGGLAAELRANVYVAQRNYSEARKHFARALEAEPGRVSAARSLAMLDLRDGKAADAKARYEKVIAAAPKNENALVALAELLAYSGAPAGEVRATIDRAIAVNPASPTPHLALIAQLRRIGDHRGAVEAARAAVAALPNEAALVEILGALQLAQGETTQARESFTKLVQLRPSAPGALLRLSEAHVHARDFPAALEAQRKALQLQPDSNQVLAALVGTYFVAGRADDALAEARRLQKERPKDAVGYLLEAEVLAAQKKYAEASSAMGRALAHQPNGVFAARHYVLLAQAGKPGDANAFAARWAKEQPKDASFHVALGQYKQATNDPDGAAAAYRAALALEGDNVVVLNNYAWLLNERGRPEAKEYAERAYQLAPLNSAVVDTLGTVLVKQGDAKRGVELLRTATRLAPGDPRLHVSLARALIATGAKDEARRELEAAIRLDTRSPAKAEAEKLLKEL